MNTTRNIVLNYVEEKLSWQLTIQLVSRSPTEPALSIEYINTNMRVGVDTKQGLFRNKAGVGWYSPPAIKGIVGDNEGLFSHFQTRSFIVLENFRN